MYKKITFFWIGMTILLIITTGLVFYKTVVKGNITIIDTSEEETTDSEEAAVDSDVESIDTIESISTSTAEEAVDSE